jgi:hypothetical protein
LGERLPKELLEMRAKIEKRLNAKASPAV